MSYTSLVSYTTHVSYTIGDIKLKCVPQDAKANNMAERPALTDDSTTSQVRITQIPEVAHIIEQRSADTVFFRQAKWEFSFEARGYKQVATQRIASARTSCPATSELFDARRSTHDTVGWLSLNRAA